MSKRIGIVLGSGQTKIISSETGAIYKDVSVICWDSKNEKILKVGNEAKKLITKENKDLVLIKPIVDGKIEDVKIFEKMLLMILDPISKELENSEIIISLILDASDHDTKIIKKIISKYKPKSIKFENRLILAALGANVNIEDEYGTIILDISYSKAIIGVVAENKIIASKVSDFAEDKINIEIYNYFKDKLNLLVDDEVIEKVKYSIGAVIKLRDSLELSVTGKDALTKDEKNIIVTDSDFKPIFTKLFSSYKSLITSVLEQSPIYIRTGVVKNGLVVTGGLSKIYGIKDYFENFFDFPARISKSNGNSVLEGTLKIK